MGLDPALPSGALGGTKALSWAEAQSACFIRPRATSVARRAETEAQVSEKVSQKNWFEQTKAGAAMAASHGG